MPFHLLDLPALFRPATSHVYPPFKLGRYMEEYVAEWLTRNLSSFTKEEKDDQTDVVWVYLPVYWTNLQNHPGFSSMRFKYQILLNRAIEAMNASMMGRRIQYVTVVQHDDGVGLSLPTNTVVWGACTGSYPLPLIYEDRSDRLLRVPRVSWAEKEYLMSFVGTVGTHPLRQELLHHVAGKQGVWTASRSQWSPVVMESDAEQFLSVTSRSKFCLAPRGYGRSSFRFFEAMLLDVIPVYVWDDVEWLPYRDRLVYSLFSISISRSEIPGLYNRLASISEAEYEEMLNHLRAVRHWFTLEGMCHYLMSQW